MQKLTKLTLLLAAAILLLYLPIAIMPGPLQAASAYGNGTHPATGVRNYPVVANQMYKAGEISSAGTTLTTGTATIRDWDKAWDAFDFAKGQVCLGCGSRGGLPGDFFIGYGNGLDKRIHVFDSPGIMDMGAVVLASVTSAPVSGYLDKAEPVESHTYVVKSAGKYGKFRITDAHEPPTRNVAEWEIEWAYQPDGSRNLSSGTTQAPVTQPVVTTPPSAGGSSQSTLPTGSGLYENYKGSPDVGGDVRMQYWHGQTLTALSGHQVSSVKLLAYRIGNPGSLIVSLRATDINGHPAGPDLASGSTSGDTLPLAQPGEWREITLSTPVNLIAGTKYAIVARVPGGGGGNAVKWQTDSTSTAFSGGNRESSGDAGSTWQSDYNSDYLFEIWGSTSGPTQATNVSIGSVGQSTGGSTSTGWDTGSGASGNLPPSVWEPWPASNSRWVTVGPQEICVDTTSNGYDMGAKTQRTYGTNTNYVVEFDFKTTTNRVNGIRLWQDGFAFVWLSWQSTIILYSGNYNGKEVTKKQLSANEWHRIKIDAIKNSDTRYGKFDVYVDGQYISTMNSSEFDMIRECGGNCILIGKYSESTLDRVDGCWKNITVTAGGSPGTVVPPLTGAGTETSSGSDSGTVTTSTPSTGTGTATVIATGTGTKLVAESRTALPGDTVLLPVKLENAQSIGSLGFSIRYDPAVIQYVKADKGALIPADATFVPNSPQPGTIIIAYATPGAINGNGTAVQLEFKAVGAQGSQSSLTLSEITATGSGGGQVTVSPSNGQVTIAQKIKGDGNGDGKVTVLDALMAMKMYVKAIAESLVLDVNSDGKVTPEDARQILKMAKPK